MPFRNARNILLRLLPQEEAQILRPELHLVPIKMNAKLVLPFAPIEHVYFPENGLLSVIADPKNVRPVEVGQIGREGVTDMVAPNGSHSTPLQTIVQAAGDAWQIEAPRFASFLATLPGLANVVMRYHQTFMMQLSYTALAHVRIPLAARLSRWLLMYHDRLDGDEIPLVHEFIAMMLGTRRPSITLGLHALEKQGAIRATRGKICVMSRAVLQRFAGSIYGVPEAHYRAIMGVDISSTRDGAVA